MPAKRSPIDPALTNGGGTKARLASRPYTRADARPSARSLSFPGGHAGPPLPKADLTASHIGVFGEGSGDGVFAKTSSPETFASRLFSLHPLEFSAHSAVNSSLFQLGFEYLERLMNFPDYGFKILESFGAV